VKEGGNLVKENFFFTPAKNYRMASTEKVEKIFAFGIFAQGLVSEEVNQHLMSHFIFSSFFAIFFTY
jgi:hypothetical protein